MTIIEALDAAQGGTLFERLAPLAGLSGSDCRKALSGLCPAIAARMQETARDPERFKELLDRLDDDEGDLLIDADPGSADTQEDGRAVLVSAYGSEKAALDEARATAKALRLDERATLALMPVAAALVLAVLANRHKELAEPDVDGETGAAIETPGATAPSRSGGGILSVLVAAIGAGMARAVMNRLSPRRRRRSSYRRTGYSRSTGYSRRRRRRQPTIEDMFRDLVGG